MPELHARIHVARAARTWQVSSCQVVPGRTACRRHLETSGRGLAVREPHEHTSAQRRPDRGRLMCVIGKLDIAPTQTRQICN
jgi:hypothetical protein